MIGTLSGCTIMSHDASVDQRMMADDLSPAVRVARAQGRRDLNCETLTIRELTATKSEGAPMGPVWGCYEIQVSGCGKSKSYDIQCQDEEGCIIPE